jgi:hypothetical protein
VCAAVMVLTALGVYLGLSRQDVAPVERSPGAPPIASHERRA